MSQVTTASNSFSTLTLLGIGTLLPFLSHYIYNRSFYQDRLGTGIGKVEKKGLARLHAGLDQVVVCRVTIPTPLLVLARSGHWQRCETGASYQSRLAPCQCHHQRASLVWVTWCRPTIVQAIMRGIRRGFPPHR